MKSTQDKIFWSGYIVLAFCEIIMARMSIFPIKMASFFIGGLMWVWTGITMALNMNPKMRKDYPKKSRMILAGSSIGIGVAWCLVTLAGLSSKVLLVSIPFLIPQLIVLAGDYAKDNG